MKISIVIPVYNAKLYIRECLESILRQEVPEIEIICVDDGSTDNSLEILNEYAQKDTRIKVITQENAGAGMARNNGVNYATGDYIHFMDADDELCENAYNDLTEFIKKNNFPDIVRFMGIGFDDNTKEIVSNNIYEMKNIDKKYMNSQIDIFNNLDVIFSLSVVPWLGLIKKDFVVQNNLKFNSLKVCNDRSFFIESVLTSQKLYVVPVYAVKHRVNNSGSLRGIRHKYFNCMIDSLNIIKNFADENNIEDQIKKGVFLNELGDVFAFYQRFYEQEKMSFEVYENFINYVKTIKIEEYKPLIEEKWYYPLMKFLQKISKKNLILLWKCRSFLKIQPYKKNYIRIIILNVLKIKLKIK